MRRSLIFTFEQTTTQLRWAGLIVIWLIVAMMAGQTVGQNPPPSRIANGTFPYLSEKYFSAQQIFDRGNYIEALQQYGDEIRGTMQSGRRNWVDSICYHARVGECHYQMGENAMAMACYDIALQDFLSNDQWLNWLQWDNAPGVQYRAKQPAPWGHSVSSNEMIVVPNEVGIDYMLPAVGGDGVQGGFQLARDADVQPINPSEVAVCLALVLTRRAELLGPLGQYDELTGKLVQRLSGTAIFPPNHWSAAWRDAWLGMALATQGKDFEAKPLLERCQQINQTTDHPLTGYVQLHLAHIALRVEDYSTVNRYCHEASVSGWAYADTFLIAEGFRGLTASRKMMLSETMVDILPNAIQWAEKQRLRGIQILLNSLQAEYFASQRNFRSAETPLKNARTLAAKHDIENGRLAGGWDYLDALNAYQTGDLEKGDKILRAALQKIDYVSVWNHQLKTLERWFDDGHVSSSGRVSSLAGSLLYKQLLREPTLFDWRTQTAESLAVTVSPNESPYEQWFALAVAQRDVSMAFEVAERTRCKRFQSTLYLGYRLMSLRFLFEAPEHMLQREHLIQRRMMLAERADLKQASSEIHNVSEKIAAIPLVPSDSASQKRLDAHYRELENLVVREEALLHTAALEGIRVPNIFPPVLGCDDYRRRLAEGTVVLMYFETMGEMYGFQISRTKCEIWRIENPQRLKANVSKHLALLGQAGAASQLTVDDLSNSAWGKAGQSLFIDLLGGVDRQLDYTDLVIVPDGFLWYMPFETLSVAVGDKRRPLVALPGRTFRYAPTAALGLPVVKTDHSDAKLLVYHGTMSKNLDVSVTRNAVSRMSEQLKDMQLISPAQLTRSPMLFGKFVPQLVVLDDVAPPNVDHDWVPLAGTKDPSGALFSHWLRLPWGGPKLVLLPGYHTAAEDAIRNGGDGRELFVPLTAMQACGAETIVISRWHSGGRSAYDQVTEFLKNLANGRDTAAQAWQRASLQTASSKLVLGEEPRINTTAAQKNSLDVRANHPFFWGAFLFCDRGHYVPPRELMPTTIETVPVEALPVETSPSVTQPVETVPSEAVPVDSPATLSPATPAN